MLELLEQESSKTYLHLSQLDILSTIHSDVSSDLFTNLSRYWASISGGRRNQRAIVFTIMMLSL